jgi:hypothetical protein
MTVNTETIKQIVLEEVGDFPDHYLKDRLDVVWNSYADKDYVAPRLREFFTKRRLIDLALGHIRHLTDTAVSPDQGAKLSQMTANLRSMRVEVITDITALVNGAAAGVYARSGYLTTIVPIPPPDVNAPDANAIIYHGDPYQSIIDDADIGAA